MKFRIIAVLLLFSSFNCKSLELQEYTPNSSLRIRDIWGLISMNGKDIKQDLKAYPFIDVQPQNKIIYGHNTCEEFSVIIENNHPSNFKLEGIKYIKSNCSNSSFKKKYIKTLNKVTNYSVLKMRLYLKDEKGKTILTYIKMD